VTATAKQTTTELAVQPRRQRVAVISAGFGQNIVLTTVSTFILVYLLQYAGISTAGLAVVTVIITVSKIVDAILDPVMGSIIDMTRTRWGKLRPYILFSAAPVALLSGLLFTVPDTSEPVKLVYFGVCYVLWSLAYTVCDVPFWGLIGSAFSNPIERTRVIGMVRAFGAIALGLSTLGMPWLALLLSFGPETTSSGWSLAVFITSVLGMAVFLLAFFFTRERQTTAASMGLSMRQLATTLFRNTPLLMVLLGSVLGFGRFIVQAGGAVFVVIAYGDEGTFTLVGAAIILGMVLSSFLTPLLLRHLTGRTLIVGSSVVAAALYVGMYLVGFANLGAILVFIFLTGLTLGIFLVTQATMIADSVDDAERRLGVRNEGISFASLTFATKIMNALAVLVFGAFVVLAGYEAGVTVTPSMQDIVFASITLVPAASCLLSAIPFLFYRLEAPPARRPRSDRPPAAPARPRGRRPNSP
jgi:sugar (glycoside-pentoside-hexuronide) transporter